MRKRFICHIDMENDDVNTNEKLAKLIYHELSRLVMDSDPNYNKYQNIKDDNGNVVGSFRIKETETIYGD